MKKQLNYVAFIAAGVFALAAGALAAAPSDGQGGPRFFSAHLGGYNEVPAISSTGEGSFEARLAQDEASLDYRLTYANLEGTTTVQAHIHLGQRDVNGGVSAFLCGGGGKPPCPPTEGTVEGTVTAADIIGPTPQGIAPGEFAELVRALRAGATYANVHTNKHPGGEIRGQIRDSNERSAGR